MKLQTILKITVPVIIFAVVLTGLFNIDSPARNRMEKLDERRMTDLHTCTGMIRHYYDRNQVLPASLDLSLDESFIQYLPLDPETGQMYEYHVLSDSIFQLCADFLLDNTDEFTPERALRSGLTTGRLPRMHHKGYQCFDINVALIPNRRK